MSVEIGKRITFKRTRPNPLFHDWLEELYEEAKQNGSKIECKLKEALDSITKYPLPLESGAECAVLKGFDKRLCLFLDKRLKVYKHNQCVVETCSKTTDTSGDESDVEHDTPGVKNDVKLNETSERNDVKLNSPGESNDVGPCSPCERDDVVLNSTGKESDLEHTVVSHSVKSNVEPTPSSSFVNTNVSKTRQTRNVEKRKYRPPFRSGCYALLMALSDLVNNQSMSKEELKLAAQKYSDSDISLEWKHMTQLVKKGLVCKRINNKKVQFCLTEDGFSLVAEFHHHAQKKTAVDDSKDINSKNAESDTNDLLFDENECSSNKVAVAKNARVMSKGTLHDKNDTESHLINDSNTVSKNVEAINSINPIEDTGTASLVKNTSSDVENHVDYNSLIEMEPNSFDIILLIDKNETSGVTKKNDPTVTLFNKYDSLKCEYRSLKVGDFTWVARSKSNKDQELVLPYVVERKRMDDFGSSIKDGRFHEQKFRLRRCGLNNVIYLVENHGSNKHVGMPVQSLMQALANTSVQDGFKVHVTESLAHSVGFLVVMTSRLIYEYKNKSLKGHNGEPKEDILMRFDYFNKSSVKNKALCVTDTFIKLLLQLKGVSVEKALTITNEYKTPRSLIEKYGSCDQKEGEMLLANLKFGELNRSVGPGVSKSIYQLFTFRNVT
ncbi:crossover junction endonuclease MUS81 [Bicyclus anynana]|uniref:Crossover junction endonuclease MUS81 n=1 Tax=Bicyclus anynana TaxID=110368 RepID=A0A6J1NSE4_BICAN|nr:crossover junction endonuclease MUS81 [Bicyclus anynana]